MGLKVKKRGAVVRNLILFILLSQVYLFIIESINVGRTALNLDFLSAYCSDNTYLLIFTVLICYFVYTVKSFSKWPLMLYLGIVSFHSFSYFFDNFDKLVLVSSFAYLLFSGYFIIFWDLELRDVVYSPGYSAYQLGLLNRQKLNVKIISHKKVFSGFFTNIAISSCFVFLEDLVSSRFTKVFLLMEFNGREFCTQAEVVTSYKHGIGLRVNQSFKEKGKRTWDEYYGIIKDRSIFPVKERA